MKHFVLSPWLRFWKLIYWDGFTFYGGGSAPAPAPTTQTIQQTNIPEYAQPYVEGMLGAAQQQVYNMDPSGNITGIKPYVPYSTDPSQYIAPFSPLQTQAQQGIANLQVPSQYAPATDLTAAAGMGSLGTAQGAGDLTSQALGYGALGTGYGAEGSLAGTAGMGYGAQGAQAGQMGMMQANRTAQQAAMQAMGYGAGAANVGMQGLGYGAMGAGYGAQGAGLGTEAAQAGQQYQNMATSPAAVQAYMNPYVQASLAPQLQLLQQQAGVQGAQEQAAATSSGAFGGTREALANALTRQNADLASQQAIGQGYNTAYQQALANMQYGSNLGLQGLQAGMTGAGLGLQGAQTGISGLSPALQGFQTGLSGVGQQLSAGQLGLSGAQAGISGAQAGMQGAGLGISGAQTGMQGAQTGLSGVSGAVGAQQLGLQGYGQAGTEATNLANIGTQQLAAQQGILSSQAQAGATQQQQQQNIINQAVQTYAMQQQYPYQQLSYLDSLIRGLPLSQVSTQNYMAAPSTTSQIAGLGTAGIAGLGLYNAMSSDMRQKENIVLLSTLPNGLNWYEFDYKPEYKDDCGHGRYRGVMAHEVEELNPLAVVTLEDGFKAVKYGMLGLEMEEVK